MSLFTRVIQDECRLPSSSLEGGEGGEERALWEWMEDAWGWRGEASRRSQSPALGPNSGMGMALTQPDALVRASTLADRFLG